MHWLTFPPYFSPEGTADLVAEVIPSRAAGHVFEASVKDSRTERRALSRWCGLPNTRI